MRLKWAARRYSKARHHLKPANARHRAPSEMHKRDVGHRGIVFLALEESLAPLLQIEREKQSRSASILWP